MRLIIRLLAHVYSQFSRQYIYTKSNSHFLFNASFCHPMCRVWKKKRKRNHITLVRSIGSSTDTMEIEWSFTFRGFFICAVFQMRLLFFSSYCQCNIFLGIVFLATFATIIIIIISTIKNLYITFLLQRQHFVYTFALHLRNWFCRAYASEWCESLWLVKR